MAVDVTRTGTSTGVNVTTSNAEVLATNPTRKTATFVNDSDEVIYLALAGTAAVNQGIRLNASGGSYEINYTNRFTGAVNAIHGGTGNKVLVITETPA